MALDLRRIPPPAPPTQALSLTLTPKIAFKTAAAAGLVAAALYCLVSGRKQADLGKMIMGAVLALASLLFL